MHIIKTFIYAVRVCFALLQLFGGATVVAEATSVMHVSKPTPSAHRRQSHPVQSVVTAVGSAAVAFLCTARMHDI